MTSNNILAATPPMGWNSWNKFAGRVDETIVRQIADAIVSTGMKDVGYQYVNIDDTWEDDARDSNGRLRSDPSRFPSGIKVLADYVHSSGLKLGIYSNRGSNTCSGKPGSGGHEAIDAQTFAEWGVDYVKYDNCSDNECTMQADYVAMREAIDSTKRPMVYSICAWWFHDWMPHVGHLWRTTADIGDSWSKDVHSFISLLDKNGGDTARYGDYDQNNVSSAAYPAPGLARYAGPGHWNDPDMLEVGNGGMTNTEYRSHFSLWAMMAAPLIAGNDLRNMSAATKDILLNTEVIAVDQDALGQQGSPISSSTTLEVWAKQLSGDATFAVVLFNRTDSAAEITVKWSDLGLASERASARDLWAHADLGSIESKYTATVPSHGVVMLRVVGE